jgi:hypothetical protein
MGEKMGYANTRTPVGDSSLGRLGLVLALLTGAVMLRLAFCTSLHRRPYNITAFAIVFGSESRTYLDATTGSRPYLLPSALSGRTRLEAIGRSDRSIMVILRDQVT